MAKCTRKLIDAEAAKAAIQYLADLQREFATHYEGRIKRLHEQCALCFDEAIAALDALPDASEQAIHAERIPVPPHLAEAQRVVIRNALAAQPQEGE